MCMLEPIGWPQGRKTTRQAMTLVLAAFFCTLFTPPVWSAPAPPDDGVAARVNGVVIPQRDVDALVEQELARYQRLGVSSPDTGEQRKNIRQIKLDQLIGTELLLQESRGLKIADLDSRVGAEIDAIKRQYGGDEAYRRYLEVRHISHEQFVKRLEDKLRLEAYLESQGIGADAVGEDEIRAFYEKNRSFVQKEAVKVRHILVQARPDAPEDARRAARGKASEILRKVREGSDFVVLAAESSDCARSKTEGGALGFVERGFMPAEFDAVAFALSAGETSDLVETEHGFHIIRVEERREQGRVEYQGVREFIRKYLAEQQRPRLVEEHTRALRARADVTVVAR